MSDNQGDRVRLHLSDDVATLLGEPPPAAEAVEFVLRREDAAVWVVDGSDTSHPPGKVAVLRIGAPSERGMTPPADHQVTPERFVADPGGVARRAVDERLTRRPSSQDASETWLGAVRRVLGADGAAILGGGAPLVAGALHDPSGILSRIPRLNTSWIAWGDQAQDLLPNMDGVTATPVHCRDRSGLLVVAIGRDGARWTQDVQDRLRAIASAATATALSRRTSRLEGQVELVKSLLGVAVHDIRGALFGLELGTRLLARVPGTDQVRVSLHGSVSAPLNQVQRALTSVRELLEVSDDASDAGGDRPTLDRVWAREVDTVARSHPGRSADPFRQDGARPPPVVVAAQASSVALVVRALIDNALGHAPADGAIAVRWSAVASGHRLEIRNPGTLPFPDLAQMQPFKHRAKGHPGLGLWGARTTADQGGIELEVFQDGDEVVAVATFAA